ncbi:cytochrome P450 [Micrococcales bacterium 31B]|nr:cytochrome P450 [Micrococcales bacterium 31B]
MTTREAPIADWVSIPDLYRDPFPIYQRLRAEGGVHWVPQVGRYLITTYAAVHETELDQQVFSANEEGSLMIRAMGHSMLRRDDPEHYVERRQWQPELRPGVVHKVWKSMFQRTAERYLEEFIEKGPGADFIADFAAPYSAESLRELIGLHNSTQADLQRWSQTMIDATGNYANDPHVWAEGKRSFDEVDAALDEMLDWHAKHPDNSLISSLLSQPGERMPLESIRANVKMTIGGGLNEPRDALGVATWALLTHPEQRAAVEEDPSLWNAAFDETIRWVAPIGLYSRQVKRDTVLEGVRLPAGSKLGICLLSANRDESVWDDAESFNIRREVKPHLAFGKGVHVCLGAWAARAEVAEVALPLVFSRLRGLRAVPERPAEVGGWVFRGMLSLPVTWDDVATAAPAASGTGAREEVLAPRVAIIGAGPAGLFTAQALRRALPHATLEVFDAQPTPFGLIRSGVAPDHQGTKSVARQFDKLFTHEGVRFRGSTRLGEHTCLHALRATYDAVVLATGMHADAALPVPGADLPGVVGAGRVTRLLNTHPDEEPLGDLGETVAVIGAGNVAMDVIRLLARDVSELAGSDVSDTARDALTASLATVHVVARSTPEACKFDPVMVRELAGLRGVRHVVRAGLVGATPDDVPPGKDARIDAVRQLVEGAPDGAPRVVVNWWFGATPEAFEGGAQGRVASVIARVGHESVSLPVTSVITAVGFAADPDSPVVPGAHAGGRVEPGLYTAGWLRRGPRGTIPDQRTDARELARLITEDAAAGRVGSGAPGWSGDPDETDFDGWRRIDVRETLGAAPGRTRAKLGTRAALVAAARDTSIELPEVTPLVAGGGGGDLPLTVWFGTESGGAELVSEELSQALGDRAAVEVRDLAEVEAALLEPQRLHVVVCSTYGDGELPTAVRPAHARLVAAQPDLAAVRYAVFGMGDTSYARTYSRGSEIVDETLAACGAVRVGEYGRHNAGGPVPAGEAAVEWIEGVLAEYVAGRTAVQTA